MSNSVKIVRFHKTGPAEVLQFDEVLLPEPGPGEIRLRVKALGLNRAEIMFRNGQYLETPVPPSQNGYEAAGIIEAVGPGVDSSWIGKTVSTVPGTFKLNNHGVYGEEGTRERMEGEFRWYVDPLDGTTNFAHGYPVFCVSMGFEHRSGAEATRVAAVVYDPTRDELFSAEQGSGARLNGKPIHVSKATQLKECLVATGFPSHKRHKNPNIHFYHQITLRTHGVRRAGSAALDLCNVASGRFDGFWEFNLNPWDTAAGVLIVEEAGGKVTRFDGSPFRIDSSETLASNGLVHDVLVHQFEEIFAGRGLDPFLLRGAICLASVGLFRLSRGRPDLVAIGLQRHGERRRDSRESPPALLGTPDVRFDEPRHGGRMGPGARSVSKRHLES